MRSGTRKRTPLPERLRSERGQDLIEYALPIALLILALLVLAHYFGSDLWTLLERFASGNQAPRARP